MWITNVHQEYLSIYKYLSETDKIECGFSVTFLSVNTEGQTYFPRKRIRYSKNKLPGHQTFMSRTILGVKPTPPKNIINTDIYETSINIRSTAITVPLILFHALICAFFLRKQPFWVICI
jgi:hypothetical protein